MYSKLAFFFTVHFLSLCNSLVTFLNSKTFLDERHFCNNVVFETIFIYFHITDDCSIADYSLQNDLGIRKLKIRSKLNITRLETTLKLNKFLLYLKI